MTQRTVTGFEVAQSISASAKDQTQVIVSAGGCATADVEKLDKHMTELFYKHPSKGSDATFTLRFLGHNCFVVENADYALVIDPWLSPQGAFFGNWFQYPSNHHLRDDIVALSRAKPCWIYFTHEHTDHFDVETLDLLSREVRVLVPRFHDTFLKDQVEALGFVCTELEEDQPFSAGGITLSIYLADTGGSHDSAVLVRTADFVFLNQNDCKVFDKLADIDVAIDFYAVQYARANWYPMCSRTYSKRQLNAICGKLNQRKVAAVLRAIDTLQPRYFLPCAGPAVFPFLEDALTLDPHFFMHHQELEPFLPSWQETLYPRPGEIVDPQTCRMPIARPTADELAAYRALITSTWDALPETFDPAKLVAAVEARLDRISDLVLGAVPTVVFRFGKGEQQCIVIDLEHARIIDAIPATNLLEVTGDARYFALMHSGQRWQDLALSLRASVRRVPDKYNEIANVFITSEVASIRDDMLSVLSIPKERVAVTCPDGQQFEIDRYCPHQGADLRSAEITDAHELVCPRHGWRFRLKYDGFIADATYTINATANPPAPEVSNQLVDFALDQVEPFSQQLRLSRNDR